MTIKASGICNECHEPARVVVFDDSFQGGEPAYCHGVCAECLELAAKQLDNGKGCE